MRVRSVFRPQVGKQIGRWELVNRIGSGGNAEVWRGIERDGSSAAIKILKRNNQYRYKRFKAEVELLLALGPFPGVLPLIDANLPDSTDNDNPAWLAMPVATGIVEALGKNPSLELVVQAIASVSQALASLSARNISHRDIKPSNLYNHEGAWKVGDFGLAAYPSKESLTIPGRRLGPMYFMADEMITNADNADAEAADVYSLSKTLWVLACGQNFPPQGQLRFDVPQLRISNYVAHVRARMLDLMIERCTHPDPAQRPRMAEVAKELKAWLQPKSAMVSPQDISDLGIQLEAAIAPLKRADERKLALMKEGRELSQIIEKKLLPLREILAKYTDTCSAKESALLQIVPENRAFGAPSTVWDEIINVAAFASKPHLLQLSSGFGLRVTDDGNVTIIAAHIITERGSQIIWSDHKQAPMGSASAETAIDELLQGLHENLRVAVQGFLERFN